MEPPPISSSFSPTSGHRHVPLPEQVEELIVRICRDQSVSPPDHLARKELARLGEWVSMKILGEIALCSVRNFSAFIMHMAKKNAEQTGCLSGPPVRVDCDMAAQDLILSDQDVTGEGRMVNSPPIVALANPSNFRINSVVNDTKVRRRIEMEMDQARLQSYDTSMHQSVRPTRQDVPSAQMRALGTLEFRRAFLILSYLGRAILEETVSMELLRTVSCMSMEEFEFHIWKEFGRNNIKPSERRKLSDWDMGKTHVYQCHVNLQGNATFKGPFLESTKTHLQRVLGDENVLQVKFEDISQDKKTMFTLNEYCDVYHRIAEQGISLGLRQYHFFVYKDGGKAKKKKSDTKSSVKCYFVRTDSGWDRDQNSGFLYGKTVNQIRQSFMHIHTTPILEKYISRLHLILSKTIKLNIDLSDPELKVETIPDIHCKDGSCLGRRPYRWNWFYF